MKPTRTGTPKPAGDDDGDLGLDARSPGRYRLGFLGLRSGGRRFFGGGVDHNDVVAFFAFELRFRRIDLGNINLVLFTTYITGCPHLYLLVLTD
jgi:hypothetical protein